MTKMRAKLRLDKIIEHSHNDIKKGVVKTAEQLYFNAVAKAQYDPDGLDEDNAFAKFSPSASLSITVANPALFGQFRAGEKYYVDFTLAEK